MDIGSISYPGCELSNFAPHPFLLDGVEIASMEGFLQSLKFERFDHQVEICKLVGIQAKQRGSHKRWWKWQTLYWWGNRFQRESETYQLLLNRAYLALFLQNAKFRKALADTGDETLTHSIGKRDRKATILTEEEFCSRLIWLRDDVKGMQK